MMYRCHIIVINIIMWIFRIRIITKNREAAATAELITDKHKVVHTEIEDVTLAVVCMLCI